MLKVITADPESGYDVSDVDPFMRTMARKYPESVRIADIPAAILHQWDTACKAKADASAEIQRIFRSAHPTDDKHG
jgi:hypothetical protein